MDGSDALLFRRMLPIGTILALEPNPRNFLLMKADEGLRQESIRIFPVAASNRSSEAPFYVVDAQYAAGRDRIRRGMSSLYQRSDRSKLAETVEVRTVRLDELLVDESLDDTAIALWIDTEGAAFQVIEGCSGIFRSTLMLHVEVETRPIIGATQQLFSDIERALADVGFVLFATDQPRHVMQFNALFIRADILRAKTAEILRFAKRARLHRIISESMMSFIPVRIRLMLGLPVTETRLR